MLYEHTKVLKISLVICKITIFPCIPTLLRYFKIIFCCVFSWKVLLGWETKIPLRLKFHLFDPRTVAGKIKATWGWDFFIVQRGEARWSLTRPTTELSSNTLTCSLRNYQTQTEYYTKIPRLYVAQYLRCENEPSAKHYMLSAEKACRLQLYNYL